MPQVWTDVRVLLFAVVLCLVTAFTASILPGLRAGRLDLAPAMKAAQVFGSSSGRMWFTQLLIPIQVALSLFLLVSTALFGRSLAQLASVDLGFQTDRILTFETDASRIGYKGKRLAALYETMAGKFASIPGVDGVALSDIRLLNQEMSGDNVTIPGRPRPQADDETYILYCSDSFFSTMGIPVLLGSGLPAGDRSEQPPVAVANEAFVKRHFGNENPIGQALTFASPNRRGQLVQIVGVVRNAHFDKIREGAPATVYLPHTQNLKRLGQMSFAIRTSIPTSSIANAVRTTVASIDPAIPVAKMATQEELFNKTVSVERMFTMLASGFGILAALLAAIGLYALMAWSVSRRTSEIGIRMALGARTYNVQWLVVRQSLMLAGAGIALGVPLVVNLSSYVEDTLYNVKPDDILSFVAGVAGMAVVVAVAAWVPARRASRVNALTALRTD